MKIIYKLFVLNLFFLLSCSKSEKQNIDNAKTINLALSSEVSTIDPANSYDGVSAQIVYQVFETLYEYDYLKRPYTLKPLLAADFPLISKDKTKYTFKIKQNVFYFDDPCFEGKPRSLKAQDFINQIKRLAFLPTKSSGFWLVEGKIKGINKFREMAGNNFDKFKKLEIEGLKAIDEFSFSIELVKPYPQILYAFAMSFTAPIPIEAIEYYKNDFSTNAVGTGPFFVKNINLLGDTELLKNPKYHGTLPDFEKVRFHLIKEDQPRWLNFLSKKIDITQIPVDNYPTVINNAGTLNEEFKKKGISLFKEPSFTYWWLSFNMSDPLLGKNKYLRLSIAHAINRERFIQLFTNGLGIPANSIIPIGVKGHSENSLPFTYNPDTARLLLKKAGYPGGRGLPSLKLDTRSTDTKTRQKAEFIKKELEAIGINIIIQTNTFPSFLTKAKDGNLQFFFDGWTMDYPDAENSLSLLIKKNFPPGPNTSFYHNPEFERLFNKYQEDGVIEKMEGLVFEDLPWIMLYYDQKAILVQDKIKNYIASDLINNYLKYLKYR